MNIEQEFLICCIEEYKTFHNLSGKEVIELFEKFNVNSFVIDNYEALHTTSLLYVVEDIDIFIKKEKEK
ncbi:MAG: DUF3791 domain-containing protein [Bacteroidales bacterium]|nr:DUF3791 domain-containing protein [Bacteroidales bacterium]